MDTLRERAGLWIESTKVQQWIIALIVFNAVMLGLQTSKDIATNFEFFFDFLDVAIPAIFLVEILIKLYAFNYKFFKSGWNIFDIIIVILCLLPEAGPLRILRTLRILRALRLVRKIPRLRILVEAVLDALPSIQWVLVLLLMVFYIYALIGTMIFGPVFVDYFGTLGQSMFSLFQIMTLESWSVSIARPVMAQFPISWLYFVSFIMIATYTTINIFIAIMVNTMQNLAAASQELGLNKKQSEVSKLLNIPEKEETIIKKENEILLILKDIQTRLDAIEKSKK